MAERDDLRAADVDRQFVADRLKSALDEGRLSLSEFDERLGETYAARTYGDLDKVLADLPGLIPPAQQQLVPTSPAPASSLTQQPPYEPPYHPPYHPPQQVGQLGPVETFRMLPRWLAGIWTGWLIAVSVNVVIWTLVSVSSAEAVYFWPMWVAGPWGAVLLALTLTGVMTGAPQREADRRARKAIEREEKERRRQERRER